MITKGPLAITQIVKDCIRQEMNENGLLSDVETFIPAYRYEEEFDEPIIWLYEHETTGVEGAGALFNQQLLQTPFEFFCVVYNDDGIEESEIQGKDLAIRVAASVKKNMIHIDEDNSFRLKRIAFDSLYPSGTVDVVGKSERAVIASVKLILEYFVDWNYELSPEKICPILDVEVDVTKG